MADFPSLLRQHRVTVGVSQAALTTMVGCDQTYISLLERGKRQPSRQMVLTLAEALGLGQSDTDRLLFSANYAPQTDYQRFWEREHGPADNRVKACSRCKAMLPIYAFSSNRTRSDRLQTTCKPCDAVQREARRFRAALRGQARRAS